MAYSVEILYVLRNNLPIAGTAVNNVAGADVQFNSWDLQVTVSSADLHSLATDGWDAPRQPDGSLPSLPYFRLVAGSALVDQGIDMPGRGA